MQLDTPLQTNRLPRPVATFEETARGFQQGRPFRYSVKPRRPDPNSGRAAERAKSSTAKKAERAKKKIEIRLRLENSAAEGDSADSAVSTPQGRRRKLKKIHFRKLERRERQTAESGSEISAEETTERQKKRYDFRRAQLKEIRSKEIRKLLPDLGDPPFEEAERSIEEFYEELLSNKGTGPSPRWALERTKLENPQVRIMYQKKICKYFRNKREELLNMLNQLIVGADGKRLSTETKKFSKTYRKILKAKGFCSWSGRCRCGTKNIFGGNRTLGGGLNFGKESRALLFKERNSGAESGQAKDRLGLRIKFPFDQNKDSTSWLKKDDKGNLKEKGKGIFFDANNFAKTKPIWKGDETIIKTCTGENNHPRFATDTLNSTVKKTGGIFKTDGLLNGFKNDLLQETQKRRGIFDHSRKPTWDTDKAKLLTPGDTLCEYCTILNGKQANRFVFRRFKKNRKRYKGVIKFIENVIEHIKQIATTMNSLYWSFLRMNHPAPIKENEWFKFKTMIFQNLSQTVFEDPKIFAFLQHLESFFQRNKFYAVRMRTLAARVSAIQHSLSRVHRPSADPDDAPTVSDPQLLQTIKDLKLRNMDLERVQKLENGSGQHNRQIWNARRGLWGSLPETLLRNPENEFLARQDPGFHQMGDREWMNPMPQQTQIPSRLCPRVIDCFRNNHSFGFEHNSYPSKENANKIVAEFLESLAKLKSQQKSQKQLIEFQKRKLKVQQLSCYDCQIKFSELRLPEEKMELVNEQALWKEGLSLLRDHPEFAFDFRDLSNNCHSNGECHPSLNDIDLDEYEEALMHGPETLKRVYGNYKNQVKDFQSKQDFDERRGQNRTGKQSSNEGKHLPKRGQDMGLQGAVRDFQNKFEDKSEAGEFAENPKEPTAQVLKNHKSLLKKVNLNFNGFDIIFRK